MNCNFVNWAYPISLFLHSNEIPMICAYDYIISMYFLLYFEVNEVWEYAVIAFKVHMQLYIKGESKKMYLLKNNPIFALHYLCISARIHIHKKTPKSIKTCIKI